MKIHRVSYKKTIILALGAGTIMGVGTGGLILTQALRTQGLGLPAVLPSWLAWAGGVLCFGATLFCLAVAIGGILALYYDAKGRATF